MYITKAVVRNFQSHEHTEVDLTKGINVFVGTSDSGKSSFLRALRWNLRNQPSGDEFIKVGSREAVVEVHWSNGHMIERRRSKTGSKNTYTLFKDGEIIEEYTGFGSKVPPQILDVTGINPDLNFNFANQLEAPFLLSETPKVRAETVGNMEELGKIDSELTIVNDDIRAMKRTQKEKATELAELEKQKNEIMSALRSDRDRVETLRVLKASLIEKDRLLFELDKLKPRFFALREEFESVQDRVESSKRILEQWDESLPDQVSNVNRMNAIAQRLLEMRNESNNIKYMGDSQVNNLTTMTEIVTKLSASHQRLVQLNVQLERVRASEKELHNSFSPIVANLQFEDLDQEVERFTTLFKQQRRLAEVKREQNETNDEINAFNNQVEKLLEEFVEALQESKVCPTCFQGTEEVNKNMVEEAI